MTISTITRTSKYIGKATMSTAAEQVGEEMGYEFIKLDSYRGYAATFQTDTGETVGTIIKIDCEECGRDVCESVRVVFGAGQVVTCDGGHVHEITEDFMNNYGFMDVR